MTGSPTQKRPELSDFLRAMRARRQPEDAGLPPMARRRTPGLRRQEVAQLAAVSVEWYVRLEQGRVGMPGIPILEAIARALDLSETERHHLHLLARGEAPPARHVPTPVSESLQVMMRGMPALPAFIVDFRFDVLAHNAAAGALMGPGFDTTVNTALQLFLEPGARQFQVDWPRIAQEMVGNLRANLARNPGDERLLTLIATLRQNPDFASWWDDQTVRERMNGIKRLLHPVGGELLVRYDVLATQDGSGHRLTVITPANAQAEVALRAVVAQGTGLRVVG